MRSGAATASFSGKTSGKTAQPPAAQRSQKKPRSLSSPCTRNLGQCTLVRSCVEICCDLLPARSLLEKTGFPLPSHSYARNALWNDGANSGGATDRPHQATDYRNDVSAGRVNRSRAGDNGVESRRHQTDFCAAQRKG